MISLDPIQLSKWQADNAEHLRYEYDVKPGELILDIGSYQREWSNGMIERYGCKAECFDALDNRAAWIEDGELTMGGAYYYTSMYDKGPGHTYKCVDISPFLANEIAVCKINIEGGEVRLLNHIIAQGLHVNIRNLQVQFHRVDGEPYLRQYEFIASQLSLTHKLTWRYPFVWESWERREAEI